MRRVLPHELASEWGPDFTRGVGVSAILHLAVAALAVWIASRAPAPPPPLTSYTVELTDPAALGGRLAFGPLDRPLGRPRRIGEAAGGAPAGVPSPGEPAAAESAKPPAGAESPKPAAPAKLEAVPKPEEATKLVEATKPVESPKPVEAPKPVEVAKAVEAPKPPEPPKAAPPDAKPKPPEPEVRLPEKSKPPEARKPPDPPKPPARSAVSKPDPSPAPRLDAKPEPKPAPRAQPRAEPPPEPKATPGPPATALAPTQGARMTAREPTLPSVTRKTSEPKKRAGVSDGARIVPAKPLAPQPAPGVGAVVKPPPDVEARGEGGAGSGGSVETPSRDDYAAAAERWRSRMAGGAGGMAGAEQQSGTVGDGSSETGGGGTVVGFEFLSYRQRIFSLIKRNWANAVRRAGLVAAVRFEIAPDGAVSGVELVSSSGDKAYDQSVVRAVQRSSPLPPPPERYRSDFREVVIDFHSEEEGGQATG